MHALLFKNSDQEVFLAQATPTLSFTQHQSHLVFLKHTVLRDCDFMVKLIRVMRVVWSFWKDLRFVTLTMKASWRLRKPFQLHPFFFFFFNQDIRRFAISFYIFLNQENKWGKRCYFKKIKTSNYVLLMSVRIFLIFHKSCIYYIKIKHTEKLVHFVAL